MEKHTVESRNETKEGKIAAELMSFQMAYPCFIKAVISMLSINFTAMNFLRQTKSLSGFGMQESLSLCHPYCLSNRFSLGDAFSKSLSTVRKITKNIIFMRSEAIR